MGGPEMRELTTPTGALLLGELGANQGPLPAMTSGSDRARCRVDEAGRRAERACGRLDWRRRLARRSVTRADLVVELQTNLDDVSPARSWGTSAGCCARPGRWTCGRCRP